MKNDDRRGENRGQSRRSNGQNRSGSPRVGAIYTGVPAARRADVSDADERPAEYRGNGYWSGNSAEYRGNGDRGERRNSGYEKRNREFDASEESGRDGTRNNRRDSASGRRYERGDAGYDRGDVGSSRNNRRESASARTYERGDAGYNRDNSSSSRQSREANHTRRDDAAGNFGAARNGEPRRGGASNRQWSDGERRGSASDGQRRGESQREAPETSREQNAPRRANRDAMPERAEEYSASTAAPSESYARDPSIPPEENENLLAGRNPIREALKSGRSVEKLLVARGDLSGAARDLIRMAKEAGAVVQEVDRSRLDAIYPAHQGLLAYVAAVDYAGVDDLFARAEERGEPPFFVLLDGVTDPHNLGAILRTAECAGAHGAILPERRSAGLGPAAAKAAAGALDCLPVARVKNLNRTIDELKERGVWVIGTAMEGEDALTADLSGPVALVIGSEGEGVSRLTLQKCDRTLTLPMRGRIESLNASVAAGILMYEVVRARAK